MCFVNGYELSILEDMHGLSTNTCNLLKNKHCLYIQCITKKTVNIWDKFTLILMSYFTKHSVRSTSIIY